MSIFYICGPMRGYKEFNAPAFKHAASMLRLAGHTVVSPLELDERQGGVPAIVNPDDTLDCTPEVFRECMARDLAAMIRECDAVYVLAGWEKSMGSRIELLVAMNFSFKLHFQVVPDRRTWCNAFKELKSCGCSSYNTFVGV